MMLGSEAGIDVIVAFGFAERPLVFRCAQLGSARFDLHYG
jgi:hypothetical protein